MMILCLSNPYKSREIPLVEIEVFLKKIKFFRKVLLLIKLRTPSRLLFLYYFFPELSKGGLGRKVFVILIV